MFRMERWSAGALLGSWVAYWVALVSVSVGPGIVRGFHLVREKGNHGRISASIDGARLIFDVHDTGGGAAWAFSSSFATVLAWVAIPPLVLWLAWLLSRPRRGTLARPRLHELPSPMPDVPMAQQAPEAERDARPS
jgi:hypothetical protein